MDADEQELEATILSDPSETRSRTEDQASKLTPPSQPPINSNDRDDLGIPEFLRRSMPAV
jgi:hypothetical protein